ncbi:MAG: hypothetical protein V2A76_16850, partial [Planctomycetota bacterium]
MPDSTISMRFKAADIDKIYAAISKQGYGANPPGLRSFLLTKIFSQPFPAPEKVICVMAFTDMSHMPGAVRTMEIYTIPYDLYSGRIEIPVREDGYAIPTPDEFRRDHANILKEFGGRRYIIKKGKCSIGQVDCGGFAPEFPTRNPLRLAMMREMLALDQSIYDAWTIDETTVPPRWVRKARPAPEQRSTDKEHEITVQLAKALA